MWPMTASTKGHRPVLEQRLGTSTSKHGGLARTQPQSWVIGNLEAATVSNPQLPYRELRNLFYLEITDPSTDQF